MRFNLRALEQILKSKVFHNILWLLFDKGYGAVLTLYVFSLLAKYFGNNLFGVWNYILALATLLPSVASLGLNFIIVKTIKERPLLKGLVLGNTFVLRFLSGVLASVFILAAYFFLGVNVETQFLYTAALILISQILLNSNVFIYFNEALLKNKNTVVNRNISLTLCTLLRIYAIKTNQSIIVFALINCFEYALFLTLSFYMTRKSLVISDFKIRKRLTSSFILKGYPLMLSAVTVMLYLKIDQVIIANLLDNSNVGTYAAASRIAEMFYALPVIISNVFFPKIVEFRNSIDKRSSVLQILYATTIVSTVAVALLISLFSKTIVINLYGDSYIESADVLIVYSWSLVFMGLLVSSSKYLLAIERNDIVLRRELLGLISNVILNFALIPRFGIVGAAWATLISYSISSFFSNVLFKVLRPVMKQQLFSVWNILPKIKL